jgi:hypothetical protein
LQIRKFSTIRQRESNILFFSLPVKQNYLKVGKNPNEFRYVFVRRKIKNFESFKSAKIGDRNCITANCKKYWVRKSQNPEIATFAEGPNYKFADLLFAKLICGTY